MKNLSLHRKNSVLNRPNIMFVADRLNQGGAEEVVFNLAMGIDVKRFNPCVCCLDAMGELGKELKIKGTEVFELKSKKGTDLSLPFQLAGILRKKNIHIIHAHNSTAFKHSVIAGRIAGVPVIIQTRHGNELNSRTGFLKKWLSRQADSIVCICEELKDKMVRNEKIKKAKLSVIRNGIDISRFRDVKIARAAMRKEFGVEKTGFLAVNIANIRPEKDQETLIRAFKQVVETGKNAKLLIAGKSSDKELFKRLKELALSLGLENHVIFAGERKDIPELLAASDLFILSSVTEGMPMSILEAMAGNIPVVSTRVGGIAEIIEDGVNGRLVMPQSAKELSETIISMINNPENALKMVEKAAQDVNNLYSKQTMLENYQELYKKLLVRKISGLKVLIIGMIPPPAGGMSVYVQEMLNSRLQDKYQLIHFDISRKTSKKRPKLIGLIYQSFLAGKLLMTILLKNPNLVHLHVCSYLSFWRSCVDFVIAKLMFRRKTILHIHGGSFPEFYAKSNGLQKKVISGVLRRADKVIVLSPYWKGIILNITERDNIEVVCNGITTSLYKDHYTARQRRSDNQDKKENIYFIGKLKEKKGTFDLLEAVSIVKRARNSFSVVLAGEPENTETTDRIKGYLKKNSIETVIRCIGPVYEEEKLRRYLNADVFVLPSHSENFPLVILEAMASGLPVIATNVGAIPEIIKDNVNGYIIEPGDYKTLAEKIIYLLDNPSIRQEMGKNNLELAVQKYDFERVAGDLDRIYAGLN